MEIGYIHLYDSVTACTADYTGSSYKEPWVSYTDENGEIKFNKPSFTIRVGIEDPTDQETIIYNNAFTKKVPVGCHITPEDFGDMDEWREWAFSTGLYPMAEDWHARIIGFTSGMYTNDPDVAGVSCGLFYEDWSSLTCIRDEALAGATVSDSVARQTFTVIMQEVHSA